MDTYNIPHDLLPHTAESLPPVIIRAYESGRDTVRNKIVLHYNMINLLLKGRKTVVHAEQTTTIESGGVLLMSCGNILTSEMVPANDVFSSILIYFSNQVLADFLLKYGGGAAPAETHPFLAYRQDAFVQHFLTSLRLIMPSPAFTPQLQQLKLEELLLYLFQQDPQKLASLQVNTTNYEQLAFRRVVEGNIGHTVTLDELAFLCHCSISTFKRKFAAIYNMPPQKWLIARKMELAAKLLKQSGESPASVYLKVGYENHSSFTQAFKQHYGQTPREYQELN